MVISPTIEVWIFCLSIEVWIFCLSIEVSIFWISIEVSIFCLSIDVVLPLLPRWWFLVKFQNVWARHQACQRDDLNIKFYATSISSSTLPQPKRKMQEEKKRMQVNQDMAVRMRTKITRISHSRRLTVPASLRTSSPTAPAAACPATPRCQKQIQRKSSQAGWWKQRFWNSTSFKP